MKTLIVLAIAGFTFWTVMDNSSDVVENAVSSRNAQLAEVADYN